MTTDDGRNSRPLASAAWADHDWVAGNYPYRPGTIWLGRLPDGTPIGYGDDRHVCLVSSTRGGKGTTSIIPNLCLWPGSMVVIDPKGENAAVTAVRRGRGSEQCESLGQTVHVLDPFEEAAVDASFRARFNPLDILDPNNPQTVIEAARLADAIVIVQETSPEQKFWDESARNLVKAVILHVVTSEEFEGRRTLLTVKKLIQRGDVEGVELLREAGQTNLPSPHGLLWGALKGNTAFGGVIADFGYEYEELIGDDPKQWQGHKQSAMRNLEFLDSEPMQRCVEASDFKLSELKTDPRGVSLYLCLPQRHLASHFRWLRMMIALVVSEMAIEPGLPKCGHDVLVLIDEFAALERLKFIENEVAQIAGYHVKLFFVLQTIEQLEATYKNKWQTLLANCGLKVFFGLEDQFSREHVSKLIGEAEVFRDVKSASDSVSDTENRSESLSESTGDTSSRSRSTSGGNSTSAGTSATDGVNSSKSTSRGDSSGKSWQKSVFLNPIHEQFSKGLNWSSGETEGKSRSDTVSRTETSSTGWSNSDTDGTSRTKGTTTGTSHGTSRGRTSGSNETVQARPLIAPNEIGSMFARVDDRSDTRFPGLALALFAGQPPVLFRRTNYYEDYQFIRYFGPHPDPVHKFNAPRELGVRWDALRPYVTFFRRFGVKAIARAGSVVNAGQTTLEMQASGPPLHVVAPRRGRLAWGQAYEDLMMHFYKTSSTDKAAVDPASLPNGVMFSLWHYGEAVQALDPFQEFAAAQRANEERARAEQRAAEERARTEQEAKDVEAQWARFRAGGDIWKEILAAENVLKKWWIVLAIAACGTVAAVGTAFAGDGTDSLIPAVALLAGSLVIWLISRTIRQIRSKIAALRVQYDKVSNAAAVAAAPFDLQKYFRLK